MLKRLALAAGLLLVVFAIGCGSDNVQSPANSDKNEATAAPTKAVATKAPATIAPTKEAAPTEAASGSSAGSSELLGLLTGQAFNSEAPAAGSVVAEPADPQLAAALLTEEDLPPGFIASGDDVGYSVDSAEGQIKMAIRMFSDSDLASDTMGNIVMSAAMALPAGTGDQLNSELDTYDQMTTDDLQKMMGGDGGLMGMTIKDFNVQKQPGLGDGGMSMHMVMDMSGLSDAFKDIGGEDMQGLEGMPSGIAYDMYMFWRGDTAFMVVVMWQSDQSTPVNALSLATIMDSRAWGGKLAPSQ